MGIRTYVYKAHSNYFEARYRHSRSFCISTSQLLPTAVVVSTAPTWFLSRKQPNNSTSTGNPRLQARGALHSAELSGCRTTNVCVKKLRCQFCCCPVPVLGLRAGYYHRRSRPYTVGGGGGALLGRFISAAQSHTVPVVSSTMACHCIVSSALLLHSNLEQ